MTPLRDHYLYFVESPGTELEKRTYQELQKWSPLKDVITHIYPDKDPIKLALTSPCELIVTFGAGIAREFIEDCDLTHHHGRPRTWQDKVIFPCYHPNVGFVDPKMYTFFWRDMQALGEYLNGILGWGIDHGPFSILRAPGALYTSFLCAIDTEGTREDFISLQTCDEPYKAKVTDTPSRWTHTPPYIFHNAVHDLQVLLDQGIDIRDPEDWEDTLLMARLCGDYWNGLKPLSYHLLGMELRDYEDVITSYVTQSTQKYLDQLMECYEETYTLRVSPKTGKLLKPKKNPAPRWFKAAQRCMDHPNPRKLWTKQSSEVQQEVKALEAQYPHIPPLPPASLRVVPEEEFLTYAGMDAIATKHLFPILHKRVHTLGLEEVYQLDKQMVPFLMRMQERGMGINPGHFEELSRELRWLIDGAMDEIRGMGVPDFLPTSSQATAEVVYKVLGLSKGKRIKRTPTGQLTTDDAFLQALRHEHPVVPKILEIREAAKLLSSYTDKLPRIVDDKARYYPDFGSTVSGRLTESILLLIPKHSGFNKCLICGTYTKDPLCCGQEPLGMGTRIRQGFIPDEDRMFLSMDLSQIELRVLAHISQDPELLRAYREGIDLHALTAHRTLGAPASKQDQDESRHRLPAKKLNFSIPMGIGAEGLQREIQAALAQSGASQAEIKQWTKGRCQEMLDAWYDEAYPVAGKYLRDQVAYAKEHNYVKDFKGRLRWLPGVNSLNAKTQAEAARQAQSFGMQAGAQEILKIWVWAIWNNICRKELAEPVLIIHDDVMLEPWIDTVEETKDLMMALLPQLLSVPVKAEAKQGSNWGDLH